MIMVNTKKRKYKVHKPLFYLLISIFILSRTTYSDVPKTSDNNSSTFHKQAVVPEDLNIYRMTLCERQKKIRRIHFPFRILRVGNRISFFSWNRRFLF